MIHNERVSLGTITVQLRPYHARVNFKTATGATLRSVSGGKTATGWHVRAIYKNGTLLCSLSDKAGIAEIVLAHKGDLRGGRRDTFKNLAEAISYLWENF